MKFDTPEGPNPIDRMRVVGQSYDRIDGPLKTTGKAPYAYERHDVAPNAAYGHVVGAAIATGRIVAIDIAEAAAAPGVIAIVTGADAGPLGKGDFIDAPALAGPVVTHYHQAVALVIAETFEQARAAGALVRVDYARRSGKFDLAAEKRAAALAPTAPPTARGDFAGAFAVAPVKVDRIYTTPAQSHMMMEPHATIAAWEGDRLTVWTSVQTVDWERRDLAKILGIPKDKVKISSPYIGGGFGGKATAMSDVVIAALGARAARRPVKLALARPQMVNGTVHRASTIQRVRIAAARDGRILAIGHESLSGNLPDGFVEPCTIQTPSLYAGENRMTETRLAVLDLPEASSMRAPGEAPGMMALEIAMDELAEALAMDPVELRVRNDAKVHPGDGKRPFSTRALVPALRTGAERFGWGARKAKPGQVRDGRWLVGMGVASAIRGARTRTSGARARLEASGRVVIETDMTDIGTGSYTIIAQTAAEMMGLPIDRIDVRLGESDYPVTVGSVGQRGATSATSGVYAACVKLREAVIQKLGLNVGDVSFDDGKVVSGTRRIPLTDAAKAGPLTGEDTVEFGEALAKIYAQEAFGAHFVEVGVDALTGEVRLRRMLAVCAAGRILNPKTARSQVIGAMTMGAGAALMEELAIDKRFGFFVNHDLASYEVPVHADMPHMDVVFLDETDATISPMKAKGVGELGLSGVAPAIANAIYNATGIRIRDYPITLDKMLDRLPAIAGA